MTVVDRDLIIRRVKTGYSVRLLLEGELDSYSCDALDRRLHYEEREGCAELVVDLCRLSFVDSNGLRVLVQAARRAGEGRWTFRVVNPQGTVRQVFDITQMDSVIDYWRDSPKGG